jgi:hypothetical protein
MRVPFCLESYKRNTEVPPLTALDQSKVPPACALKDAVHSNFGIILCSLCLVRSLRQLISHTQIAHWDPAALFRDFLYPMVVFGRFWRPWILDRAYILVTIVQLRFNKTFCSVLLQRANDLRTPPALATSGRRVPKARPSLIELIPLITPSVL